MKTSSIAVAFSTLYLFAFIIALHTENEPLVWTMFLISPLVVVLTVYVVIRYGVYEGHELNDGEEWGYEDFKKRPRD